MTFENVMWRLNRLYECDANVDTDVPSNRLYVIVLNVS